MTRTEAPAAQARVDGPEVEMEDAWRAQMAAHDEMQEQEQASKVSRREAERRGTLDGGPLPDINAMIAKIPPPMMEMLDDLFRAKFQGVKRVPEAIFNDYQPSTGTKALAGRTLGDRCAGRWGV